MTKHPGTLAAAILTLSILSSAAFAQGDRILVQSTTSTQNSGFYDYILPIFTTETGLRVDIVAVGTGQAIRNAMNGDADVLLVHAKPAEEKFVADGYGVARYDLMYNDFVLIGPQNDPDNLSSAASIGDALTALLDGNTPFVSRGDDSGTNKKELALWESLGVLPTIDDGWYREVGAGMGATIRMTIEMQGYTLTDRATWIAYGDKQNYKIVYQGDPALFNQYGIIAENPDKFPDVNAEGANIFINWLLSPHGQQLIAAYRREGQQLFFPNAAE